jgi:hypothetical protein
MWFWRRMEKVCWTDRVRHEVLRKGKGDRNILCTIKRRKATGLEMSYIGTAFENILMRNNNGKIGGKNRKKT